MFLTAAPPTPSERPLPWRVPVLAGLGHALLMILAFPPVGFWFCAVFAPIPIVILIRSLKVGVKRAALLAAAGTAPFWLFEQAWITRVSALGYLPLVIHMVLWTALLVYAGARIRSLGVPLCIALPLVWVGLDFCRGSVAWGGYPWYFIAHPLIDAPLVPAIAPWFGVYGVTLMVVLACSGLVDILDRRRRTPGVLALIAALALLVFPGFLQGVVLGFREGLPVRVAVIQTNVPSDNKVGWTIPDQISDFGDFSRLTLEAARSQPAPDLVVWPETMLPGGPHDPESIQATVSAGIYRVYQQNGVQERLPGNFFSVAITDLQQSVGMPMLVGAETARGLSYSPDGSGAVRTSVDSRHNSAILVADGRITNQRYDKLHLTPFGEVMPLISRWEWLERRLLALGAGGMTFDLAPGPGPSTIDVELSRAGDARTIRIATPICFEATMSALCRDLVFHEGERRADLLINLTNDGWFGWFDAGRRQHMQLARWRCVELSTPMIRAANTGISTFIDARGRVLHVGVDDDASPDAREAGVRLASIPTGFGGTMYASIGDLVGWIALAATALLLGFSILRSRLSVMVRS